MRHSILSFVATSAVTAAIALIACSSSDDSHALSAVATPASVADAQNYCAQYCSWQSRCNLVADAAVTGAGDCKADCVKAAEPHRAVSRAAFFQNVASCFSSLQCNHYASFCADNFSLGDPTFPNIKEVDDCLKKYNTCSGIISQDRCNSIAVLTQDHRNAAEACLSNPDCTATDTCLGQAGAYNVQE